VASIDFGYAHIFVANAAINMGTPGTGKLVGNYDNSVDILSLQYNQKF
jgi:long-subunit fatty acid transport protein